MFGSGNFFSNLFGANGNPFAQFGQNEQQLAQMYAPWANKGLDANNFLYNQWKQNATNPNGLEDSLASHFQNSPYQSNLLNMTQQRLNANAANTGMLGSTASNAYMAGQLNDMTGQFQNDYIDKGMQTYGMGMNGMNQIADRGMNALNQETGLDEQGDIAAMKAQQQDNSLLPNMLGTGLGVAGAMGGFSKLGSMFSGGSQMGGMAGQGLPGGVPYAMNSPQMGMYSQGYGNGYGMNGGYF